MGRLGQVSVVGAELLTRVVVTRWKTWPAVEKCLLKFKIITDFSAVTVFPNLSAVGSWEEVLLFSMENKVPRSQTFFEFVLQDENFCLKKLALAFLTACVHWFLTSLKSCISRGLFDANAEHHRMVLCRSRTVRSGENQGFFCSWF